MQYLVTKDLKQKGEKNEKQVFHGGNTGNGTSIRNDDCRLR